MRRTSVKRRELNLEKVWQFSIWGGTLLMFIGAVLDSPAISAAGAFVAAPFVLLVIVLTVVMGVWALFTGVMSFWRGMRRRETGEKPRSSHHPCRSSRRRPFRLP